MHPTLDKHPQDGAPILREEGYPEEVDRGRALARRAPRRCPRDTPLKKTLFACDELSGFVHACGLVRPDGTRRRSSRSRYEEAEAAVVRRGRQPRRGLQGRGAARRRAGRAHRDRHRGAAARSRASSGLRHRAPTDSGSSRPVSKRSTSSSLVHQPHETRSQPVPGTSRTTTPASQSRAAVSAASLFRGERNQARLLGRGNHFVAGFDQPRPARRRDLGHPFVAPPGAASSAASSPAMMPGAVPNGVEAGRAGLRRERLSRRRRRPATCRSAARPAGARDRARRALRSSPVRTATSARRRCRSRTRRLRVTAGAATAPRRRGSKAPARRGSSRRKRASCRSPRTCESAISFVRLVSCSETRRGPSSGGKSRRRATRTFAGDASSGPSSPKCSMSVVTISSSPVRPRPASTTLHAFVVELTSATFSGATLEHSGQRLSGALAQGEYLFEVRIPAATLFEVAAVELRP